MSTKNSMDIIGIAIIILGLVFSAKYIGQLRNENKLLHNNQEVFLDSIQKYKIADSLNAVKVNALALTNKELKKHIADDVKLIKKLKADKPETIIKTETKTEYKIKTKLEYVDTLKAFQYHTKWIDVIGLLNKDSVDLQIKNREELLLVESLQKKKFLGIKLPIWLFGYKTKSLNATSKNPNTEITNIEYIQIRK